MEKLLNEGATLDYVDENGQTGYYWTLFWAKQLNNEGAKKVLEKFDQKWKNEIEKNWTIRMAVEEYWRAARIIKLTGKTEIVTNSKHPIISVLRMMGEEDWKEEYSRKIIKDLNLKSTLQTDLNFMLENKITESDEFEENFSALSKILKEFSFDIQYDESNKTFVTNFPLTETDATSRKSDENVQLETVLARNRQINEQITKLNSENANLTTEMQNLINMEIAENRRIKEENKKLLDIQKATVYEKEKLRREIKNFKNAQKNDHAKFSTEISQLKKEIAKLNLENGKIKDENKKLLDTQKSTISEKEKLKSQNVNLTSINQNLKNAEAKFSTEISELKKQIEELENDLEEKLFMKPSKEQHREIEELFIKSRNVHHNIPNYKIVVNIQTKNFFPILIYFFRKFEKSTTKNC